MKTSPANFRRYGARAVPWLALWLWCGVATAQQALPGSAPGAINPADIARSERRAVEAAAGPSRPLTGEELTDLVLEQLQTGGQDSAETVLEQLREAGVSGPSFMLDQVVFEPVESAVLTEGQLATITSRYTGREVVFVDLLAMIVEINEVYREAGYPLSRANLPPQDIAAGTVRVELIEARLGEVRFGENQDSFLPGWSVRGAVDLDPGEPLQLSRMERGLLYFNRTRGGSQLGALLEAGSEYGTTDVLLQVEDPPRNAVSLVADNAGRESVGKLRSIGVYQRHNLTGFLDDRFVLGAVWSEGAQSVYTSYDLYLPGRLPQITLGYSQGETEVVGGGFESLGIEGESRTIQAGISQPVWVDRRWTVLGGLDYLFSDSETDYGGLFVQEEEVQTASLSVSASRLDGRGGWFANQALAYIQGETLGTSDSFLALRGSLLRQHLFSEQWRGSVEFRYQYGDEGLPTSERFALGGVESLRGYPESGTLADSGYLVRAELSWLPLVQMRLQNPSSWSEYGSDFLGSVEPFVFLDHGMGFDIELFDQSTEDRMLNSAGAGLRVGLGRYLAASVSYAQPFDLPDQQEAENFLFRLELTIPWGH